MRILLDSDGVIVDLLPTWLAEYNALCQGRDNVRISDITDYEHSQFARFPKLFWQALTTGDCFRKAAPLPGAIGALRWLNEHHEVYIVTYSHESVGCGHCAKLDWYQHYAPFINPDQLIFTKHKWIVDGDVLVEDNPMNIVDWWSYRHTKRTFLINHLYNRGGPIHGCTAVKDLYGVITELQHGTY